MIKREATVEAIVSRKKWLGRDPTYATTAPPESPASTARAATKRKILCSPPVSSNTNRHSATPMKL